MKAGDEVNHIQASDCDGGVIVRVLDATRKAVVRWRGYKGTNEVPIVRLRRADAQGKG